MMIGIFLWKQKSGWILFLLAFFCAACQSDSPLGTLEAYYIEPDFTNMGPKGDLFPAEVLQEAKKNYSKQNYQKAISTLEKMPFNSGSYNHSLYLIATIALKQGNGNLAVEKYRNYLNSQDQRFIEQAPINLALAYLHNDQPDQAKLQIADILENKNAFSLQYIEKARAIHGLLNGGD